MIRLERHGLPAAPPPLVAIPGIDGSIASIAPIVKQLARRREVVVVNYTAETNPTLEELSAEIASAIRAELPSPVDLLGQSIGTILTVQVAGIHRSAVRKVILIATFTRLRWFLLRVTNILVSMTPRWLYRATTPAMLSWICGPVGDGRTHPFFAASRNSDPKGVVKRTAWEINRDFASDLARLEQPARILMGAEDRFVPNARREIAKLEALFTGRPVTIRAIPKAGHVLLPSAAIAQAVSIIDEFLG